MKRSKKILLIPLLIAAHYLTAYGQDAKIGLYAGANFPNVNIASPDLSADMKAGYQAGVFFRKGEILYGQVGAEYQMMKSNFVLSDGIDVATSDDVSFHAINVPLYIGVNLLPLTDNLANVRVYAGPTASYLFNVPVNELDFTADDFKRVRLDGGIGAGLDILVFSVDVAYNFGVNELFTDEFDGRTNYAAVNIGIHF